MPTILAIDDRQDNLLSLSALLKSMIPGCLVVTASSGSQGVEKAKTEQPDTILLDIHMPGMDGFEACRILKSDPQTNHIPVIMLTAVSTDSDSRVKGLEIGADAFLSKPVDWFELVAQVKVMLRIKKAEDTLRKEKDLLTDMVEERTEKLKVSEEKYQDLYNNAPDMFCSVDANTAKIVQCNQTLIDMLGYTRDEIIGHPVFELYTPDSTMYAKAHVFPAFVKVGTIKDVELQLQRKNGSTIDVSLNVSAVRDREGNIIYSRSSWRDITDRKQAEENLVKSKEWFRTMFEQAPYGIALIDSFTGHIYEVNPRFAKIVGRARAEMANIDRMSITHPDDVQKDLDNMALLNAGKIPGFGMKKRYVLPDGSHVWVHMTVASLKVADSSRPRHLCMIQDITNRMKADEEKETLEAQLRQAQKMEAIGTLAGGIAHDFNNILFPIIGYAEMMIVDAPEGSDLRDSLNEVLSASFRARDLVQQILAFSRQAEKQLVPLKTQIIVREVSKLMRASLPSTIAIEQHIDKDCGKVFADPTHIHQIAMNFMTNAFHAMEENGGILGITLSEVNITAEDLKNFDLDPGIFVCLSVSDTGHGIEKHILDRIFEPYFTTKNKAKGTGLGLSVVHGIVKSYNGEIHVYSEPGKGTVFNVYLPMMGKNISETKVKESYEPVPKGDERILVVDDEEQIVTMITKKLQ